MNLWGPKTLKNRYIHKNLIIGKIQAKYGQKASTNHVKNGGPAWCIGAESAPRACPPAVDGNRNKRIAPSGLSALS